MQHVLTKEEQARAYPLSVFSQVDKCPDILDGQAISNALYGMQMLGASVESRGLALALSRKVTESARAHRYP